MYQYCKTLGFIILHASFPISWNQFSWTQLHWETIAQTILTSLTDHANYFLILLYVLITTIHLYFLTTLSSDGVQVWIVTYFLSGNFIIACALDPSICFKLSKELVSSLIWHNCPQTNLSGNPVQSLGIA